MRDLRYMCVEGLTKDGRLLCTTGDEVIFYHYFDGGKSIELTGVKDLVAIGTAASTCGFTLELVGFDGTPYNGAVAGDIVAYKGTSTTPITISSCTASGNSSEGYHAAGASASTVGLIAAW